MLHIKIEGKEEVCLVSILVKMREIFLACIIYSDPSRHYWCPYHKIFLVGDFFKRTVISSPVVRRRPCLVYELRWCGEGEELAMGGGGCA